MDLCLTEESRKVKGYINNIIPFSNVDGPGNRFAIFFQGCNMRCLYCHNPETQKFCSNCGKCIDKCETNSIIFSGETIKHNESTCIKCDKCLHACQNFSSPKYKTMTVEEIIELVVKAKPFIRGVTISGGECTEQLEFLHDLVIELKKLNLHILIDTNASFDIKNEFMQIIIKNIDGFMIDIKHIDNELHKQLTGIDNEKIISNLQKLIEIEKVFEVRTVIFSSEQFEILSTVETVAKMLNNTEIPYNIIKYHSFGVIDEYLPFFVPPKEEIMDNITKLVKKYDFICIKC